jgi:acetyl esterase/lipase
MSSDGAAPYKTVDDYLHLPTIPADQRIPYGEEADQFGDLYLPSGDTSHPVAIVIHGGCWRAQYDLVPIGSFCDALRQEGLAVWSLEYRRLGNGGGWPATFQDVAAGIDFLRVLAGRFPLDLTRVISIGHSAGGHLALWAGGRHRLPGYSPLYKSHPLPVIGIVSLAGIPDLAAAVRWDLCQGACAELLGGTPDERPERYQQASPVELLPLGAPQRHIVGSHDASVPSEYLEAHVALARQSDDVHLDVIPSAGHFEPVIPDSVAWPTVRNVVLTLLGIDSR